MRFTTTLDLFLKFGTETRDSRELFRSRKGNRFSLPRAAFHRTPSSSAAVAKKFTHPATGDGGFGFTVCAGVAISVTACDGGPANVVVDDDACAVTVARVSFEVEGSILT